MSNNPIPACACLAMAWLLCFIAILGASPAAMWASAVFAVAAIGLGLWMLRR